MKHKWTKQLIILLPLVVILWVVYVNLFPKGHIYNSGDFSQPVNLEQTFGNLFHVWGDRLGAPPEGGFFPWFSAMPYYLVFYRIPLLLGLDDTGVLSFIMFMFLFLSYLSFSWAAKLMFNKKRTLFSVLYPLVYALNLTTLYFFTYTWGFSHQVFIYMTIPLLAASFYLFVKETNVRRLAYFLIMLFITIPGFTNSAFFVALSLYLVCFLGTLVLVKEVKLSPKTIAFLFILGLTSLLTVSSWLFPTSFFVKDGVSTLMAGVFDLHAWLKAHSASLISIFLGVQSFTDYFPFRYSFKIAYFFSFIPITTLLFLLFMPRSGKNQKSKVAIALVAVGILFMILLKKSQPPFGGATLLLFKLPLMATLRSYEKTGVFIPFTIFMAIYGLIPNKWFNMKLAHFLLALTLLAPLPFFIGKIQTRYTITFAPQDDYLSADYSGLVKIPEGYTRMAEFLNNDRVDSKIQALPFSPLNTIAWVNYPDWKLLGTNPVDNMFDKPTLLQNSSVYSTLNWIPSEDFNTTTLPPIWYPRMLSYFNISHAMYHLDVAKVFLLHSYPKIKELVDIGAFSSVMETNEAILYGLAPQFKTPHFYVPTKTQYLGGSMMQLPYMLSFDDFVSRAQMITLSDWEKFHIPSDLIDESFLFFDRQNPVPTIEKYVWQRNWAWPELEGRTPRFWEMKSLIKERLIKDPKQLLDHKLIRLVMYSHDIGHAQDYKRREVFVKFTKEVEKIKELLEIVRVNYDLSTIRGINSYLSDTSKVLSYLMRINDESDKGSDGNVHFTETALSFYSWVQETKPLSYCSDFCYEIDSRLEDGNYSIYINYYPTELNSIGAADVIWTNIFDIEHKLRLEPKVTQTNSAFIDFGEVAIKDFKRMQVSFNFPLRQNLLGEVEQLGEETFKEAEEMSNIILNPQVSSDPIIRFKEISPWVDGSKKELTFEYKVSDAKLSYTIGETILKENADLGGLAIETVLDNPSVYPTTKELLVNKEVRQPFFEKGVMGKYGEYGDTWHAYTSEFTTSHGSTGGYLFFYGSGNDYSFGDIQIKNINIRQIPNPTVILKGASMATEENLPQITITKVRPTKYRIGVKNATAPFPLVFNESFHAGWKLSLAPKVTQPETQAVIATYYGGDVVELENREDDSLWQELTETLNTKSIAEESHYRANGYANAWLIKPVDVGNLTDYELIVEFRPQLLFYAGILVTAAMVLLSVFVIIKPKGNDL